MATDNGNGPRAKCDQVVYEAMAKAAEIIVSSRGGGGSSVGGGGGPASPSSTRFNLQVAEIPSVRSILQGSKRALHVPIRLDVYYQHDAAGEQRELLERWCLEYVPHSSEYYVQQQRGMAYPQDSITQLRHVCKRIVVWLRTLYCSSRLLPGQLLNQAVFSLPYHPIGFSIYNVASDNDNGSDVSGLLQEGFSSQQQPASVTTPYGELVWRVWYTPRNVVERFVPSASSSRVLGPVPATSIPRPSSASIPIPANVAQQPYPQQQQQAQQHGTYPPSAQQQLEPQSAPAHFAVPPQQGPPAGVAKSVGHALRQSSLLGQQQQQQHTNDPSRAAHQHHHMGPPRHAHSAESDVSGAEHHHQEPELPHAPGLLQRRHTTVGSTTSEQRRSSSDESGSEKAPERVLSGLSLALLQQSDEIETGIDMAVDTDGGNQDDTSKDANDKNLWTDPATTTAAKEKRRAALHQMPPHLVEAASPPGRTSSAHMKQQQQHRPGEYGYAYNSHIPWQAIHPSSNNPTTATSALGRSPGDTAAMMGIQRTLSSSPGSMGGAALYGTTPPTSGGPFSSGVPSSTSPAKESMQHLIPPRNAVTPPFAPRPAGFVQHEPSSHLLIPSWTGSAIPPASPSGPEVAASKCQPAKGEAATALPPAVASLDLLHLSPFQQHPAGSLISSLSFAGAAGTGGGGPAADSLLHASSDLRRSLWSNGPLGGMSVPSLPPQPESMGAPSQEEEEMPFAVDFNATAVPSLSNPAASASQSQLGASSSAAIASFAQQCAGSHRLQLFESQEQSHPQTAEGGADATVDQLAQQLAEFRSFGASMMQERNAGSGSSEHDNSGASSATPIPLQT